jgi:hypothetical protein
MPFKDKITFFPDVYDVAFNTDNKPFSDEEEAFTSYAQRGFYESESERKSQLARNFACYSAI